MSGFFEKICKRQFPADVVPGSAPPPVLSPEEIVIIIIIKQILCPIKIRFLVFEPELVLLGHL